MKTIQQYMTEKLVINKSYTPYTVTPQNFLDLYDIIKKRLIKYGGGTRKHPIDLNDINTNKINTMCELFELLELDEDIRYPIRYIDISQWDVSNIISFDSMFYDCKDLISVGDLCDWEINTNEEISMQEMFYNCRKLTYIGNLSKWNVSNVLNFKRMFSHCRKLTNEHVGDILKCWKISPNAIYMSAIWDSGIT